MKTPLRSFFLALLCTSFFATAASDSKFEDRFEVEKSDLRSTGENRYFVLIPGFQLVLEGKEHGKPTQLTITVLDETKKVDGVETRVVEEKETSEGEPVEISRNYFAISHRTGDVFYFGEEVDIYKHGKIVKHEGAWQSGAKGARFGLMMPGKPVVGARFQQEVAPDVAMDRAEIVSLSEALETTAGKFTDCLKTAESSTLESGTEHKIYAPRIGIVQDAGLKLVRYHRPKP
jgi:hypothetical protein